MIDIEPTADAADRIYAAMANSVEIVRRRLGRPLTLSEKILLGHLNEPETAALDPGESYLRLRPDRVVLQDVLGQTAMLQFMQTGRDQVAVPTTIHCDHLIQARTGADADLAASSDENQEVYDFLRSAAARYGAGFWQPGAGIIHQVVLENYAVPGQIILGTDSHTPTSGGLGAAAVGVGGADAVEAMAGLPWEVLYPRRIAVFLTGELGGWSAPKDIILWLAGQLTVSGATNAVIEYIGPGARTLSATGKATIANMGAELGATTSLFGFDSHSASYLAATGRAALLPVIKRYRQLLEADREAEADPAAHYDRALSLNLSTLEPHVVGPHSPDRARPLSQLAADVRASNGELCDEISVALIGSCTNSSYQDMSRAADVARQARSRGLMAKAALMITPGSEQIRATIARDGLSDTLSAVGGVVLANACGPCIGQWRRDDVERPNTIVTSYNRNFPARNDGRRSTMNYIASPEIVTALAIAGRLSFDPARDSLLDRAGQPFQLAAPAAAPEIPAHGYDSGRSFYIAPPPNGDEVALRIEPHSERLQALAPWPAWNGEDFVDLPLLVKTRGKTTTDHISPAGVWLKYRGHLERFSDNLLQGATNADSGEIGKTINSLNGSTPQSIAQVARAYRTAGLGWVIVGDANYGEGSSREHAALSPRLLGGAAVIARSFARIHETNLKKQGLLALTFTDVADYERIRRGDRISLFGLADLAPGRPIECRLRHADGTTERIVLRHSYSSEQVEWFRAGSALNTIGRRACAGLIPR